MIGLIIGTFVLIGWWHEFTIFERMVIILLALIEAAIYEENYK